MNMRIAMPQAVKSERSRFLKSINEEAFRLLQDETRRKIVFLLRENELTVREIASRLNLTAQNIYHHIKKLQDAGLVKVTEEKRSGHLIESYYTVTADTFVYHSDEIVEKSTQSFIDILNGLNEIGAGVEVSIENANKLSKLHEERIRLLTASPVARDLCSSCGFSGYFMKLGPMNPVLLERILQYRSMMEMTDQGFEKSLELTRELRHFLLSIRTKGDRSSRKRQK